MRSEPLPLRFERHYIPEPNSGCWLWTGAVCSDGYGCVGEGAPSRAVLGAHRVSWELHRGPIPPGVRVLHRCDVPACVNPEHLFLGTQLDNMRDCVKKDRFRGGTLPGELASRAKLTADQVRTIRRAKRWPNVCVELAAQFGVSVSRIRQLRCKNLATWVGVK